MRDGLAITGKIRNAGTCVPRRRPSRLAGIGIYSDT